MARIVVADTDSLHLDMVLTALERAGHQAEGMVSGDRFLQCLMIGAYDLLLVDIGMTDSRGRSVVESLPRLAGDPPVVGMTSAASSRSRSLGQQGRLIILHKPFSPTELQAEVHRLLATASAA